MYKAIEQVESTMRNQYHSIPSTMEIPSKKDMYYVILFYLLYHVREKILLS